MLPTGKPLVRRERSRNPFSNARVTNSVSPPRTSRASWQKSATAVERRNNCEIPRSGRSNAFVATRRESGSLFQAVALRPLTGEQETVRAYNRRKGNTNGQ